MIGDGVIGDGDDMPIGDGVIGDGDDRRVVGVVRMYAGQCPPAGVVCIGYKNQRFRPKTAPVHASAWLWNDVPLLQQSCEWHWCLLAALSKSSWRQHAAIVVEPNKAYRAPNEETANRQTTTNSRSMNIHKYL